MFSAVWPRDTTSSACSEEASPTATTSAETSSTRCVPHRGSSRAQTARSCSQAARPCSILSLAVCGGLACAVVQCPHSIATKAVLGIGATMTSSLHTQHVDSALSVGLQLLLLVPWPPIIDSASSIGYATHRPARTLSRAGGCGPETRQRSPILPGFDTQLETCVFHLICRNADELVLLKFGQPWRCDLSESRLHGLRLALMNTTRELRLLSV